VYRSEPDEAFQASGKLSVGMQVKIVQFSYNTHKAAG
jgi:hypothetical protein